MTIEYRLKNLIIAKYNSISEFSDKVGIAKSTMHSILTRGVENASIRNIAKICAELNITIDGLVEGEIVPISEAKPINDFIEVKEYVEIQDILADTQARLLSVENLRLDGEPITDETAQVINQGLKAGVEMAKKFSKSINKTANKN